MSDMNHRANKEVRMHKERSKSKSEYVLCNRWCSLACINITWLWWSIALVWHFFYNPSKTLLRRKVRNVFVVFQAGGNDPQFTLTLRTQNISAVHWENGHFIFSSNICLLLSEPPTRNAPRKKGLNGWIIIVYGLLW